MEHRFCLDEILGEDDKPFVWEIPDRLHNALDFSCDTY